METNINFILYVPRIWRLGLKSISQLNESIIGSIEISRKWTTATNKIIDDERTSVLQMKKQLNKSVIIGILLKLYTSSKKLDSCLCYKQFLLF
jgi:hypothetical protein